MKELWKEIEDTLGDYRISNKGRVWSKPREGAKGGILKFRTSKDNGVSRIVLTIGGEHLSFSSRELLKCYWPQAWIKMRKKEGSKFI